MCSSDLMDKLRQKTTGRLLLHVYTLLVVILGFVMFRATDVHQGFFLLSRMFSFTGAGTAGKMAAEEILTGSRIAALLAGIVFSVPIVPALTKHLKGHGWEILWDVLALAGLVLSVFALSGGSFSPFIYQQF